MKRIDIISEPDTRQYTASLPPNELFFPASPQVRALFPTEKYDENYSTIFWKSLMLLLRRFHDSCGREFFEESVMHVIKNFSSEGKNSGATQWRQSDCLKMVENWVA